MAFLRPEDLLGYQWDHASRITAITDGITIAAPPETDYFIDPAGRHMKNNAPFLYTDVTGDFVMRAQVRHGFVHTWDACAVMVRQDDSHWAKLCFEATDLNTRAVVSVVTKDVSDDANGVNIAFDRIWLQAARLGSAIAFHYSHDGDQWHMVRVFRLTDGALKVGLLAQCPAGSGTTCDFLQYSLERRTITDLRKGY